MEALSTQIEHFFGEKNLLKYILTNYPPQHMHFFELKSCEVNHQDKHFDQTNVTFLSRNKGKIPHCTRYQASKYVPKFTSTA